MPEGADSPVRLHPGIASGASTVGSVRTEILREQYEVGEDTRDIAEMFHLNVHDVLVALRHEDTLRPRRAEKDAVLAAATQMFAITDPGKLHGGTCWRSWAAAPRGPRRQ